MTIRLIVGLGNPGAEYELTRHNAGFWFVDNLALSQPSCILQREARFQALYSKTTLAGQSIHLLEPQTFMNLSGRSVAALAQFYKIAPEEILVVHDELDLPPGQIKLKKGGSAAGHNGLKDITRQLGTQDYWRLRIGIDHPRHSRPNQAVADYVLHRPSREEQSAIEDAITRGLNVLPQLCQGEFEAAMQTLHSIKTQN